MRAFFAIIIIVAIAFGGIFFFSKGQATPQTSVDGTTDVGEQVTLDQNAEPADETVLLGDKRNVRGDINAKVVITEFSDYQCPYCKVANEQINNILAEKGSDVALVYRHFPLSSHPLSQMAAEAAEAARAQGKDKFWEMHDMIFENQTSLTENSFAQYAEAIGLDVDQFNSDMESGKYADLPKSDYQDGVTLAIQGTPTFYINGIKANISSFSDLSTLIDQELAK